MAYNKFFVDNVKCSRRFHLSFDDEKATQARTHVECPHCGITIFSAKDHPAVAFARDENLVKTTTLAEITISDCNFKDTLSERTIPKSKLKHQGPIYPHPNKA